MSTANIILEDPKFVKAAVCYVSIYESNDVYGGPEEGGWWHTYHKFKGSVKFYSLEEAQAYLERAESQAEKLKKEANANFRNYYESRFDDFDDIQDDFYRGEVASADDYWVIIEDTPGSRDNSTEPIPHWE